MRRVVSTNDAGPCRALVSCSSPPAVDGRAGNVGRSGRLRFRGKAPSVHIARRAITLVLALIVIGALGAPPALGATRRDRLYIGNDPDSTAPNSTVQSFDATGNPLGTFISATPSGAIGPRGILHLSSGKFLVAYQNTNLPISGEIDEFASNGTFLRALVPSSDPAAPYAPSGMILGPDNRTLYVADQGPDFQLGAVEKYNVRTGAFLGDLDFKSFINSSVSNGEFHPRALVFAPDRRTLYLSLFSEGTPTDPHNALYLGWVLRYDTISGRVSVVASYDPNAAPSDCHLYLHKPRGLTTGPKQDLYVLSQGAPGETDKVLVFNPTTGACRPWINLDQPGQNTYARGLVFGPGGKLYLPITAGSTTDPGGVRAYDVYAHPVTYTEFVSPTAVAGADWWYLTFGNTNPTTLAYGSAW
jgi:hypothetical protein